MRIILLEKSSLELVHLSGVAICLQHHAAVLGVDFEDVIKNGIVAVTATKARPSRSTPLGP